MLIFTFDKGTIFERTFKADNYVERRGDDAYLRMECSLQVTPTTEYPDLEPFEENRTITTVEISKEDGSVIPVLGTYNYIRNIIVNATSENYTAAMIIVKTVEKE